MAENPQRTKFLTVAEVADMVRVSRMTVYRWVHAGELPAVRFGRSFRVPQEAVEQFMEQAALAGGYYSEDDEQGTGTVG
ncbi:helix-turn-helix domain-containing protein [Demequina lignilytica]|uniref:Helix-turn-helix domain-containing protein n=1 Tax=Demequina lignilytica TaxID=3051663 RepID=A0AAW7MA50_9MICO|nr:MULTISPECIES: helix-turn-helix domain-containing protein [unclassified Demequina]MDN4478008.1 helix-turn-helix domain-containing protein [Demequina sp. SYSU T00039-1]MDN4482912.1 helix-turn-helix domain-containing protein [Demequina sp. SYSU T0a273]MDN4488542.1 helix-turn-helix domain-containing protein [Demequina sp. SYSU T00039]MDN4489911.1 helix-turn-helix domain-containing protein [Demequina sp. SYSU T00068]